ncbi:MAG: glycosyltransferase family 2 protein, partial [Gammaproteobacteria bacterium]
PDFKVRLFNRTTARWGGINPHDRVQVDGEDIVTLGGDILHYSFDSISGHLKTIDSFTEIGAREIIARGKRAGPLSPVTHGLWTFLKLYLIKRGFLDGYAGFVVSVLSGMHAFVKYAKVILQRRRSRVRSEG